jgi:hypothetical protein
VPKSQLVAFSLILALLLASWVLWARAEEEGTAPEPAATTDAAAADDGAQAEAAQARAALRQKQQRIRPEVKVLKGGADPEAVGTVAYDPGTPADFFRTDTGSGNQIVGNRFNSASGSPLLATGALTQITLYPYVTDSNVLVTILTSLNGTTAFPIVGISAGGIMNGYFVALLGFSVTVGSDFLMGQYVGTYLGPDSIGVRSASVNGQGFHGMQINFVNSAIATGFTTLPGQNPMIRATGNILVPVELMSFTAE